MEYRVKAGTRIAKIALSGTIDKIVFDKPFRIFSVKNKGDTIAYVSFDADIVEDGDGVYDVDVGETVNIAFVRKADTLYAKGTGTVEINASNIYVPLRETAGSGSVTEEETTIADVDEMFAE